MAQEQGRQLEVKLYNRDDTIHLQISPMNTLEQIVEILIEDDLLDKDIDLNSLTFADESGQKLLLKDETSKIKKHQNKYKIIIKGINPSNSQSQPSQGQPSQIDQDCIQNALEASLNGNKDSLKMMYDNSMLTQGIYNKFIKVSNAVEDNKKLSNKINDLQKKIKTLLQKIQDQKNQIQTANNKLLKQSSQQKPMIDMEKVGLKKEKQQLQIKNKQLIDKFSNIKQQTNTLKKRILQLEQENKQLRQQGIQYYQQIQKTQIKVKQFQNRNIQKLYFSKILYGNENKKWLIQTIQKLEGSQIEKDQLLYKYDPFNKTNFHKYIDDKPHILIVIQTKDNKIIGAYSQSAFRQGQGKIGSKSFLFDLKARSKYQLKSNERIATQYDPYFIVFGNDELLIKQNQNKVKASFRLGNSQGSYNIPQLQADKFLFNDKREKQADKREKRDKQVQIISFEIFQFF